MPAPGKSSACERTGPDVAMVIRRGSPLAAAAGLLALAASGCGSADTPPAAQPAPEVTTFEQGRFDDLPVFFRSDPLGPRSEKEGVVTRSYEASGASPEQVLEFYRDALAYRWRMVTPIERLGPGTFRADWEDGQYRLRVSATQAPALDPSDDGAHPVLTQYSLTLRRL